VLAVAASGFDKGGVDFGNGGVGGWGRKSLTVLTVEVSALFSMF